ncbi:AAA family ATPase [Flammeovirga sp. EKP202]|uniref:AAA family ATPase n=1 Tax=Flammeovirga sp. EKP202 TaxID=2770592 RepID=UPI00165F50C3|nr:AAA family ATPase [Flammeovirga sp. EKP202]MBD0403041.1 AAA family ATPase [Flammeovirga sp. EKP202]
MELIIFTGIQGSGKSTLYKQEFFNSHIRVSIDLLNTRNKENKLLDFCFQTQSKIVIDNTNPSQEERAKYIELGKQFKYKIVSYFFESNYEECLERNNLRSGKERIPEVGLKSFLKKLLLPTFAEGFDEIYYITQEQTKFVKKLLDEI